MRPKRNNRSDDKNTGNRKRDKKADMSQKRAYVPAKTRPEKPQKPRVPVRFALAGTKIVLEIEGFNQSRLLSELGKNNVKIGRVTKISPKTMRIIIEEKYSANCFAICRRMCYNYTEVERFGAKYAFSAALKRVGFAVAAILIAVAGVTFSGRLNAIEVTGTDEARRAAIAAYLADGGVKRWCRTSSLNADSVRDLVLGFDGVAECSVELRGTSLIVTVRDKDVPAESPDRKKSIESGYDAIVTRVVALGGTAKVKPGDTVKKGQTLIEGALYRTDGEPLRETDAVGTVYGRVIETKKFTVTETRVKVVRTGKKFRSTELDFFGLKWGGKAPDGTYEVTETHAMLCGFITVKSRLYEETTVETVSSDVDELIRECEASALAGYFGSGEITVKTHVVALGAGAYEITVYTENERIIS